MLLASLGLAAVLSAPPADPRSAIDFDPDIRAAHESLDSPYLRDALTAAMALPYRYGVTQMPCKARQLQPALGWVPAREPAGRIQWSRSANTAVKWAGIYGTCYIQSPMPREQIAETERLALECVCNGWLPKGVKEYPLP